MKMTSGKLAGMKAVSNARGVIAAAAMDQRGSLQKALAKERGGSVGDRELEEFKKLYTIPKFEAKKYKAGDVVRVVKGRDAPATASRPDGPRPRQGELGARVLTSV